MSRVLVTLLLVNSLLLAPVWVLQGGLRPHWLALEAVMVVGLFVALPVQRWCRVAAWVTAVTIVIVFFLQIAETTARLSLARSLNLYLDVRLLDSVANLLLGTLGTVAGSLVMVVVAVVAVVSVRALARLLAGLRSEADDRRRRLVGGIAVVVALLLMPVRWYVPGGVVLGSPAWHLVRDQTLQMARMMREQERFAAEMAATPSRYGTRLGLLDRLEGRDVVLAFIESYGVAVVDDERYAPIVGPRLEAMEHAMDSVGLHVVTGTLEAPSQGGMSWLGHGSVLSGLWLENQLRYDLLLSSDRQTLVDDFEAAGYRTVALMPAITLAWPEGRRLGYEKVYARNQIDYAGPPLNWVTMPDQFTWSFLQRRILEAEEGPVFAEIGLISSHAPWTPILTVFDDWDGIGDGEVFDQWADVGETPEELWRDTDRVREHYALAIGYAVDVLSSYAARYVDDGTLLIALGDHQPAPLITGEEASRSVPVHVFARDPEVLRPFLEWGFVEGAVPDTKAPAPRMDAFRSWFIEAYTSGRSGAGS